jgi:hypothetical protein
MNLIDLACSERVKKSGVEGDLLKETLAINKSHSALQDVICALHNPNPSHILYRNSKLSTLLKPYMNVGGKILMVCCNTGL